MHRAREAVSAIHLPSRRRAEWLYRQIKHEYDDLISDETVDEAITASECTFTAPGQRVG